jgi:FHS family L-fucose permease-like MFS transporter
MAITQANSSATTTSAAPQSTNKAALSVVTTLFFMWGFLTALNDILIPHLKPIFDLNYAQAMLIQFAFFSSYFVFSIPSGKIIDWVGYKRAMVIGIFTLGIGAFLFIPAAMVASYPLFLGALIVLAAGMTVLQVSANPYVAVLGPPRTASSRLNLAQAFNSLGTTIAPFLGGLLILGAVPSMAEIRHMAPDVLQAFRVHQASSVKLPYIGLGLIAVILGIAIALFKLPVIPHVEHHKGEATESIWKYRHLLFGVVGIFAYVGAEVSIGSFLVNYFSLKDIGNITEKVAAGYVSFYWGSAMVGRFIGSAFLDGIKTLYLVICSLSAVIFLMVSLFTSEQINLYSHPHLSRFLSAFATLLVRARPVIVACLVIFVLLLIFALLKNGKVSMKTGHLLGLSGVCALGLVLISMFTYGHVAMWSIILVGLFNSIMFPSIFTSGIDQLGPLTSKGSTYLIMAIVGGAILPELTGILADKIGIHHAFIIPAICYLYIMYYGYIGSKPTGPGITETA